MVAFLSTDLLFSFKMLLLKATVLALLALAVNGDQKLMGDDKLMLNESGKGRPGLDHKLVNEAGKPRAGMGRKKRSYRTFYIF